MAAASGFDLLVVGGSRPQKSHLPEAVPRLGHVQFYPPPSMIAVIVALRSLSAAAELVAVVSGAMSRSPVALPRSRIRRERVGNVRAGRRKWTATL